MQTTRLLLLLLLPHTVACKSAHTCSCIWIGWALADL